MSSFVVLGNVKIQVIGKIQKFLYKYLTYFNNVLLHFFLYRIYETL